MLSDAWAGCSFLSAGGARHSSSHWAWLGLGVEGASVSSGEEEQGGTSTTTFFSAFIFPSSSPVIAADGFGESPSSKLLVKLRDRV